jgi:hypothetical protein
MPLTFPYTFLLLAAGALVLFGRRRRLGLLGLVPVALGIAAITIRLGGGLSGLALRAAERGAPLGFLQINTGLILLGITLVLIAVGLGLVGSPANPMVWLAAVLVGGGAAPIVVAHLPLLSYTGWLVPIGAAAGIGIGATAIYLGARLLCLSRPIDWLNRKILGTNPLPPATNTVLRAAAIALAGLFLLWRRARAPEDTDYWAPLFMPLALLILAHVAGSSGSANRRGRLVEALLAMGFFGIFAGGSGVPGAAWLLAAAVVAPWMYPFLGRTWSVLFWLPVAWGMLRVLTGGLGSQVTYTILAAAGVAVAIRVYHPRD